MNGRDADAGEVRRALGASADEAKRRRAVEARLREPQANLLPARGQLDREGRIALFCTMAEKVSATVAPRAAQEDVPTRSPRIFAGTIFRCRSAPAPIPRSRPALGARAASRAPDRPLRRQRRLFAQPRLRAASRRSGTLVLAVRAGQSDDAEFPPRHAYRHGLRRRHRRRLRDGLAPHPRDLRPGQAAAHGQPRHRSVALRRHRADADPRRARPPRAAYPGGGTEPRPPFSGQAPPAPLSSRKIPADSQPESGNAGSSGCHKWLFFSSTRFPSISARSPR